MGGCQGNKHVHEDALIDSLPMVSAVKNFVPRFQTFANMPAITGIRPRLAHRITFLQALSEATFKKRS